MTPTHLSYIVNNMAADDLATQGTGASAAIIDPIIPKYSQMPLLRGSI